MQHTVPDLGGALQSYAGMTRREFMICVAASALLVASGCATFRRGSEVDAALGELESLLSQFGDADEEELMAIAERIGHNVRALLDKHERFGEEFNARARDRSVSDESLQELANDYEAGRVMLRNELLRVDQELFAALPVDANADVLELLNRKSRMLAPQHGMER
jgi:ElaB/YqjD/DUF883 family membrane-anchored ribosome-binding protein